MTVEFEKSIANGSIEAPPSKSYSHRALICGAFSEKSTIRNVAVSNDIKATLSCLQKLGANTEISDKTVIIGGIDRKNIPDNTELDCLESGSTLRFLIPVCLTLGKKITLKGSKRLFERPISEYENLCRLCGFTFEKNENSVTVEGELKSGDYILSSDVSSQYISGFLFALSLLKGKSTLTVKGNAESKPYIEMTVDTIKKFGTDITVNQNCMTVQGKGDFKNTDFSVEGDCSNAALIDALNFLGGNVGVCGLNDDTLQGDYVYKKMFNGIKMGEKSFCLSDCPDLAPIMFAVSVLSGGAEFRGTKRLKFKESDRAAAMKEELSKFGVCVTVNEDSVIINSDNIHAPDSPLSAHNDHRICMALALLCAKYGGIITGAESVNKSYPDYFGEIKKLGVKFTLYET